MMYNFIGDIHGRSKWKALVKNNAINVFVGDYFASYDNIPFEECKSNFLDIIEYKKNHPKTVLLIGNHDAEYWFLDEKYLGHDNVHHLEIKQLFIDNAEYFKMAFSIDNKILVTHAGVSYVWLERYMNHTLAYSAWNCNYDDPDELESPYSHKMVKVNNPMKFSHTKSPEEAYLIFYNKIKKNFGETKEYDFEEAEPNDGKFVIWKNQLWRYIKENKKFEIFSFTPDEVAKFVNKLFENGHYLAFDLYHNNGPIDDNGTDCRCGPLWIRPEELIRNESNIFIYSNYWQVVGHTRALYRYDENKKGLDIDTIKKMTILEKDRIVLCDCLDYNEPVSILYDDNNNGFMVNCLFEK